MIPFAPWYLLYTTIADMEAAHLYEKLFQKARASGARTSPTIIEPKPWPAAPAGRSDVLSNATVLMRSRLS